MTSTFDIIRTAEDFRTFSVLVVVDPTSGDALTGTDKQVSWATKVRAEMLATLNQVIIEQLSVTETKGGAEQVQKMLDDLHPVIDHMLTITDAGWWLDRRHLGAMQLLRDGAQARRDAL